MIYFFYITELLFLNVPLLGCRLYIAAAYDDRSVSVFLVKNIIGILFGIVEVYDCSFEYVEFYKGCGNFKQTTETETEETKSLSKLSDVYDDNDNVNH